MLDASIDSLPLSHDPLQTHLQGERSERERKCVCVCVCVVYKRVSSYHIHCNTEQTERGSHVHSTSFPHAIYREREWQYLRFIDLYRIKYLIELFFLERLETLDTSRHIKTLTNKQQCIYRVLCLHEASLVPNLSTRVNDVLVSTEWVLTQRTHHSRIHDDGLSVMWSWTSAGTR